MKEKELIERLDMYESSKQLFVSSFKTIKKERNKCLKQIKKIKEKPFEELDDFELTNYRCLRNVLSILNVSLRTGKRILTEGVDEKKLKLFYRSIYHLYIREGNEL